MPKHSHVLDRIRRRRLVNRLQLHTVSGLSSGRFTQSRRTNIGAVMKARQVSRVSKREVWLDDGQAAMLEKPERSMQPVHDGGAVKIAW